VDLDLGLEFTDALLRCGEFGALGRRQPCLEATVDAVLATPQVDRLFTDPEVACHIGDLASRFDKIEDAATELRRITPSSHCCLLSGQQHRIQLSDSTEPGADHDAAAASEKDGPIVHHIENRILAPTDFSPLG
jgi:hypothetical protein